MLARRGLTRMPGEDKALVVIIRQVSQLLNPLHQREPFAASIGHVTIESPSTTTSSCARLATGQE